MFTTVGTHTITVIGTANGVSSTKTITITVIAEPVATPDTDGLALAENKVTFGITNKDLNRTVILNNGSFGIVNYSTFEVPNVESEDFIMSLRLTNSFEASDKKIVTIGMKIVDNSNDNSNRVIFAVIPNVTLNYNDNQLSVDTNSSSTLYGYGKKSNGTPISTEVSNLDFSRVITINSNQILSLNHTKLLDLIYEKISSTNDTLAQRFFSQDGNYTMSLYVSGLDSFGGFKADTNNSLVSPFSGDLSNNISNKFDLAKLYSLSGNIIISKVDNNTTPTCSATQYSENGKCVDNNPAPQFTGTISSTQQYSGTDLNISTSSYFSDVNDTLSYGLNCSPTNVTINRSTGLISGTVINNNNDPVNSACKVIATDSIGQSATSNEFNITVLPLGAPQLSAIKIADNNFTGYSNKYFNLSVDGNITSSSEISYTWFNGSTNVGTGNTYNFDPTKSGVYPIKVIASANDKNTTKEQNITVLNSNPVITVIKFPSSCEVNKSCEFNVSVSDVDNDDVLSYMWEINGTNQNVNSKNFSHTFSTTGEYNVSVEVNDGTTNGLDVESQIVSVVEAPTDPFDNNTTPQFTGTIASIQKYSGTDLNISTSSYFSDVNDTLSYGLNCSPTNVTINSSTGLISGTVINNNNDPVNSACKVTATDSIGQSATSNEFNITVLPLGAPQLSAIKIADNNFTGYSNKYFNLSVDGNITSSSEISYTWFNGSTNVGTGNTYNFDPTKSGVYPIKVIASANDKNTTKEQNITVLNSNPVITVIKFPSSCEVNKSCEFNISVSDVDNDDVLSYMWDINGTNQNVNSKNFSHTFSTTGEYNVSVKVNDGTTNGFDEKNQTVSVVEVPTDNYNITTDYNLRANNNAWNDNKIAVSLTGTMSSSIMSLGSDIATLPTDPIQGTDGTTVFIVETAGDTSNFIELKFSSAYANKKIFFKLGNKTVEIDTSSVTNNSELVLQ